MSDTAPCHPTASLATIGTILRIRVWRTHDASCVAGGDGRDGRCPAIIVSAGGGGGSSASTRRTSTPVPETSRDARSRLRERTVTQTSSLVLSLVPMTTQCRFLLPSCSLPFEASCLMRITTRPCLKFRGAATATKVAAKRDVCVFPLGRVPALPVRSPAVLGRVGVELLSLRRLAGRRRRRCVSGRLLGLGLCRRGSWALHPEGRRCAGSRSMSPILGGSRIWVVDPQVGLEVPSTSPFSARFNYAVARRDGRVGVVSTGRF